MKKDLHPQINIIKAICSCGTILDIYTILNNDINIDICYKCHPFYTGQQRIKDNKGRIEKFNIKYSIKNIINRNK